MQAKFKSKLNRVGQNSAKVYSSSPGARLLLMQDLPGQKATRFWITYAQANNQCVQGFAGWLTKNSTFIVRMLEC